MNNMDIPAYEWREKFEKAWKFGVDENQRKANVKLLIEILLTTERARLVERILKLAPGLENTQTGEVTNDLGVMEYMARIQAMDIVKSKV